jgi:hypothetical protein
MNNDRDDPNAFNKAVHRRTQEELAELDNPRAKYQAILDRWIESQRDLEAEHRATMRRLNEFGLKIW